MTTNPERFADLHCDLALEVLHRRVAGVDALGERWLPELRAGGVEVVVASLWPPPAVVPDGALRTCLQQALALRTAVDASDGAAALVRTVEELDGRDPGSVGLILSMEGCDALAGDPALLDVFVGLGVRMVGLTWMRRNAFADGDAERGGLTAAGRELLARIGAHGLAVDLAHLSDAAFWEVLDAFDGEVCCSHVGAQAVHPIARNLDDDQIRAIAARGGVIGLMIHPSVLGGARLEDLVTHIAHVADVGGPAVPCIGADFNRDIARSGAAGLPLADTILPGGWALDATIDGCASPAELPKLATALHAAGLSHVAGITHANALAWLRRALQGCTADPAGGHVAR